MKDNFICNACGELLNSTNWPVSYQEEHRNQCLSCRIKYLRNYYKTHYIQHRKYLYYGKNYREKLKLETFGHYSPELKCQRCGFSDIRTLSIDHINGRGYEQRKLISSGSNMYRWLRNNDYPEGYQVLCMNCQWIKRVENRELPFGNKNAYKSR